MTFIMAKMTARQRILEYMRTHHGVSAAELARALRVSAANVRHHLAHLAGDGRVQVLGERSGESRGRPTQVYGLSDAALGDNLSGLADAALGEWLAGLSPLQVEQAVKALSRRLQNRIPLPPDASRMHMTRRLALAIDGLNRLGYQARWEAHATGPRVIFGHCPYAAVISAHPELCRMDAHLLEAQLAEPVRQAARLERNERGLPVCVFSLR
jgi:predicted ArsR family transcriptional regulator